MDKFCKTQDFKLIDGFTTQKKLLMLYYSYRSNSIIARNIINHLKEYDNKYLKYISTIKPSLENNRWIVNYNNNIYYVNINTLYKRFVELIQKINNIKYEYSIILGDLKTYEPSDNASLDILHFIYSNLTNKPTYINKSKSKTIFIDEVQNKTEFYLLRKEDLHIVPYYIKPLYEVRDYPMYITDRESNEFKYPTKELENEMESIDNDEYEGEYKDTINKIGKNKDIGSILKTYIVDNDEKDIEDNDEINNLILMINEHMDDILEISNQSSIDYDKFILSDKEKDLFNKIKNENMIKHNIKTLTEYEDFLSDIIDRYDIMADEYLKINDEMSNKVYIIEDNIKLLTKDEKTWFKQYQKGYEDIDHDSVTKQDLYKIKEQYLIIKSIYNRIKPFIDIEEEITRIDTEEDEKLYNEKKEEKKKEEKKKKDTVKNISTWISNLNTIEIECKNKTIYKVVNILFEQTGYSTIQYIVDSKQYIDRLDKKELIKITKSLDTDSKGFKNMIDKSDRWLCYNGLSYILEKKSDIDKGGRMNSYKMVIIVKADDINISKCKVTNKYITKVKIIRYDKNYIGILCEFNPTLLFKFK